MPIVYRVLPYCSMGEASRVIGVDHTTIRRYCDRGILTVCQIAGSKDRWLDQDEVLSLVEKRSKK